jgi:hypothetical protein
MENLIMKNVAIIVIFLLAVFASLPALAGTVVLYDNTTSITGTEPGSSWQIAPCCGVSYVVTDSFTGGYRVHLSMFPVIHPTPQGAG